jgi:hypothetical protein
MIDHGNALEFPETGKWVLEPFRTFWLQNGSLSIFGYPWTGAALVEGHTVQIYFERCRMEVSVDEQGSPAGSVQLGRLGVEHLEMQHEINDILSKYYRAGTTIHPNPLKPKT